MARSILVLNGGSSSIKFALFTAEANPRRFLVGQVERIGFEDAAIHVRGLAGSPPTRHPVQARNHDMAAGGLLDWLQRHTDLPSVAAVGHRIVHGGMHYSEATSIDDRLMAELRRLSPIDPLHLPAEIALIDAMRRKLADIPQVACFDTAFHHNLPKVAKRMPIPRRYDALGVRRYGFHGLSFAYLMAELQRLEGPRERAVLAHLGMGASLAAVRNGKCIDTTMAFTPTAGLVMGTRSGDLDPGLLIYLMRTEGLTVDQLDELVNHRSGLLGISETSSDMRDLLARQAGDPRAEEAVSIFCYRAKKEVGAFAAALNGLDALVFAGGIGENAPEVRARICDGLEYLGLELDADKNAANSALISTPASRVSVRVLRTDEELTIARNVSSVLGWTD